jgi:hypothetical protein
MPYYYHIEDERLRMLVLASESVHSLAEDDCQKMIDQIAGLDPDAQEAMVSTLEEEQRQIAAAKRARGITPRMELAAIGKKMLKLETIEREFVAAVRAEEERSAQEESGKAEDVLAGL